MDILKIAKLAAIFKIANEPNMSREDMDRAVQQQINQQDPLQDGGPVSADQTAADWLNEAPTVQKSQGEDQIAVAISNENGIYGFRPLSTREEIDTSITGGKSVVIIDRERAKSLISLNNQLQDELKKLYNSQSPEDVMQAVELAKAGFARIELIKIAKLINQ